MRSIEAEINRRRAEPMLPSGISTKNFRGIELRDFAAEIARLALVIAEYQCDVQHRGPLAAKAEFLPLDEMNWITCGNALRLDWLQVCPPVGTNVKLHSDDLFQTPLVQPEINFENEGGETYICGNPPYAGDNKQSRDQKADLGLVFEDKTKLWKSLDYVSGWFMKAAEYGQSTKTSSAFVSTNSICQGNQVPILWPILYKKGQRIFFAQTSFKWANLAAHNAGVTVVIVGMSSQSRNACCLYSMDLDGTTAMREVENINAYLVGGVDIYVKPASKPAKQVSTMQFGNHPYYAVSLLLDRNESRTLVRNDTRASRFVRPLYGSKEFISGVPRSCVWITASDQSDAEQIEGIKRRIDAVLVARTRGKALGDKAAQTLAKTPYRFRDQATASAHTIIVPGVSSERRPYLPVGLLSPDCIVHYKAFALYDTPLWNMALIASRLHWVWIGTVCVRMRTDFSYSNTLGWNTFPVPILTEQNKDDLSCCAEDILLAREAHFPATLADLYDPEMIPQNLLAAHQANDEVLERIYIGRRFRNDTERLEKLFEMYTKMTATPGSSAKPAAKRARRATA